MLDNYTEQQIEKISKEILNGSKSIGLFPTPVTQIREYTEFALESNLDLQNIDHGFIESIREKSKVPLRVLQSALDKLLGMFNREEKTIYLDPTLLTMGSKKSFVELHEIGHGVLSWQQEYFLYLDNSETIKPEVDEQFEAEANHFASYTLFQGDIFKEESKKLKLGITSAMELAKKFGASVHATLRNYVLHSPNRCVLLVLTPIKGAKGNGSICETRNIFHSKPFIKDFGLLDLPESFGYTWNFIQNYKRKRKMVQDGKIELTTLNGELLQCTYHFFNNSYNPFVLLFPKGEKNKSRIKVILRQSS
jgi:hypothetical protein